MCSNLLVSTSEGIRGDFTDQQRALIHVEWQIKDVRLHMSELTSPVSVCRH